MTPVVAISQMSFRAQGSKGFTLIELLIVVAIIGILASAVVVNLSIARARARDARRQADLKSVQTALEIYLAEKNEYPSTQGVAGCPGGAAGVPVCGEPTGYGGKGHFGSTAYIAHLAPEFVGLLPADPLRGKPSPFAQRNQPGCNPDQAGYLYASDGTNYKVIANCTIETALDASSPFYDPIRPNWAFALSTPGARTW